MQIDAAFDQDPAIAGVEPRVVIPEELYLGSRPIYRGGSHAGAILVDVILFCEEASLPSCSYLSYMAE